VLFVRFIISTVQVIMMNDKANQGSGWISSLDIINKTGISRATLNNYIKMNLLPRPTVKKTGGNRRSRPHARLFSGIRHRFNFTNQRNEK